MSEESPLTGPSFVGTYGCKSCGEDPQEAHPGYGEQLTIIGYKAEFRDDLCLIPNGSVLLGAQEDDTGLMMVNVACDVCGRHDQWLLSDLISHMVKHALGQSTWEEQ